MSAAVLELETNWRRVALALLALTALLSLPMCVTPGPVYVKEGVTYHPDDLTPCKAGTAGCTVVRDGNIDVYYSTLFGSTLEHENEHALGGMRHTEPWTMWNGYPCVQITDPGKTKWVRGQFMCRDERGNFFAR